MARHYFTNFFVMPPIFPSEEQKKKVSTYCYSHYGPSPNLLVTTRASMHPSSTVSVSRRLSKLTEEHDLPVPAKLWTGVLLTWRGGCFSTPSTPLNPPLPSSVTVYAFISYMRSQIATLIYWLVEASINSHKTGSI